MSQAYKLAEQGKISASNRLWSKIDRQVTLQAPMVSLFIPRIVNIVSRQVGGFEFSPLWYFLVDQAWVK
jgi:peptide/nickel transport system substrate-binding protein